jgi:class 3 adenylate cyclase
MHEAAGISRWNLASRLCDGAASEEILMDTSVRDEIVPAADATCLGARALKGFPDAVPMFRPVGLQREPEELIASEAS